jgi:hypothetical protein
MTPTEIKVKGHVYYGRKTLYRMFRGVGKSPEIIHGEALLSLNNFIKTISLAPHPNPNILPQHLQSGTSGSILLPLFPIRRDILAPSTIPGQHLMTLSSRNPNWNEYQALLFKLQPLIDAAAACLKDFDPVDYAAAVARTEQIRDDGVNCPIAFACFASMRLTLNYAQVPYPVMNHEDLRVEWSASIFLGNFKGGEVSVPYMERKNLKEALKGQYGDVLLMKNAMFIGSGIFIQGQRYQLDFFVPKPAPDI